MGPALQVFERLPSHSFGTVRDRPVEAGLGAEMGDGAQIRPEEPDLRLLFGGAPAFLHDIFSDRQEAAQDAEMMPERVGRPCPGPERFTLGCSPAVPPSSCRT